ncbi:MAG: hypothetical protein KDA85_16000, partial [Planctomycetaceae bacterium]|nr:hypothetical protein [Planctomycetaceae bacterium]
ISDARSALRKAASLLADQDLAIEVDALASLLDSYLTNERYTLDEVSLNVRSASELLTRMEQAEGIVRDGTETESEASGSFGLLQSSDAEGAGDELIADIEVIDGDADEEGNGGPRLVIAALNDQLDQAVVRVRGLVGDLITTSADQETRRTVKAFPAAMRMFDFRLYASPEASPAATRQRADDEMQTRLHRWLDTEQPGLDNKTPRQAAADPATRRLAAGLLLAMHQQVQTMADGFDLNRVWQELELPAPVNVDPARIRSTASLSFLQFRRVDLSQLNDDQLTDFAMRSAILGATDLAEAAIDAILERPDALEKFGLHRAGVLLSTLARERGDVAKTLHVIDFVRQRTDSTGEGFRQHLE